MKKTLLFLLSLFPLLSMGQTVLSPGDIIVVAINGDVDAVNSYDRGFSFMPLVNLEAGTVINFTDYGWSDVTGAFITQNTIADAFIHYTAPTSIAAGTIIRCDLYSNSNFTFDYSYAGSGNNYLNLSGLSSSDELLIFQGNRTSPTFIFAVTFVTTGWATSVPTTGVSSGSGSALPGSGNASVADLADDVTALSFNQVSAANDNSAYTGPTTAASKANWQTRIQNYANWTFNDIAPIPTPPVGPFTVSLPSTAPTVTTEAVSSIASTTATGNGTITSLGSPNPTAHGVCWNTTGTPTTSESKVDKGAASATGSFTVSMTSLAANNTYYVRAYATNTAGTSYGTEVSFTTLTANNAPTDIALSASSINENVAGNSTVGTLSSTDPDVGNTFTYTLVAGTGSTDNASFNISGSSLRITSSPDFETKSSYSVRVRTTDQGSLTYEKAFTITINNVNETPTDISLSANSVNENVVANSTIGTLSSNDPDVGNTFTYTLVVGTGDTDNASFNISGSSLRITNSPDFESKSSYSVRVRTTDQGSLTYEKAFTITINNVNETPTDISLSANSINENVVANSTIGTLSSNDPDVGNTFTYTLVVGTGDTDNASFNISGSSLRITNSPDFETKSSYSVRVRTTDQGSLTFEKAFTITINNVNEAPTDISLSASSINENVVANSTVGTLSSTDPDAGNTFTYTLVAGTGSTDNASFNISGSSLRITNSPDFESKSSYSVRVRTTDQGSLTYEKAFTITINNVNETPTDISLSANSINENVVANSTIGTLSSTDPDVGNTFTYTLVVGTGDTDNASFNISGSSLRITSSPDFEAKSSYSVRVRTTDQGSLTYEKTFTITINNVNETPTNIELSIASINENVVANSTVGTLSTTDSDVGNTFTYTLVAGTGSTDNASFNISGSSLRITISPDFETKSSYSVRVRTTDQGSLTYEKAFTITINDLNDVIPVITVSQEFHVTEQSPNGTTVGTVLATDGDVTSTTFQNWTITAGNSGGYFTINSSSGVITVLDNTGLNPAVNPTFTLTLTVSDGTNTSSSQTVSIVVAAINDDNPVITASQSFAVNENSANSTIVGTVLATDPDYGTAFQGWAITAGNTSNGFAINSTTGVITVNTSAALDYESTHSFSLTIQVSDGIHTGSGVVTVNLNNLNDNIPAITGATFAINENSANGTAVGTVVATDADGTLNSLTYSITAGNTNSAFAINAASGAITVNNTQMLDFETTPVFSLTVRVSDGTHTNDAIVTINLNNIIETGIDDNKSFSIKVYPNPAVDKVSIYVTNPTSDKYSIDIIKLDGIKVYQSGEKTLSEIETIDLTGILSGIYILRVHNNKFSYTDKLIVQ